MSVATQPKTETIQHNRAAAPAITTNPERMSGQSVIAIHRIQLGILLDYVDRVELRQDFPSLTLEEIENAIQYLKELGEDGRLGEPVNF